MVMVGLSARIFFLIIFIIVQSLPNCATCGCPCCFPTKRQEEVKFEQKTDKFWEFEEETNRWVEVSLPFDLMSCANGSCTKVGSIERREMQQDQFLKEENKVSDYGDEVVEEKSEFVLPLRRRISLTLMTESSIWVTGQSGSIYEKFWNGVQWVIAPHELPTSAGPAISIFIINQTILALSEAGTLYQLQLNENSQPIWIEFLLTFQTSIDAARAEPNETMQIKSGLVSHDGERLYTWTVDGLLLEISELHPLRWDNHGSPPGADVAAVADAGSVRPGVVFTVSSNGDLYEFDKKSKPSWKKHIWTKELMEDISLMPSSGCVIQGLVGAQSVSLFLLTKDGFLIERYLHKRKWKWRVHGVPQGQYLSAITAVQQSEPNEKNSSMFLTTTTGFVFEYQLQKHSGHWQGNKIEGLWVNHMHPQYTKVARGIKGVQLQIGRMIFALDDGRLGELHLPGIGGENPGPHQQISIRRKTSDQYEWSILETPETEGWNAEYCTDERGPSNCIIGIKDMVTDDPTDSSIALPARRRKAQELVNYISLNNQDSSVTEYSNFLTKSIHGNFRMRVMHEDRSFFLISEQGLTFEYLYADNVWLWLRHEHSTEMKAALGRYNGSLFLVDTNGNLLMRERSGNELSWINCTAMKKGRQVMTGPPWDSVPGKGQRVTTEDAIFFVSKKGRLLQFTVALRNFKWKDCRHPLGTKVAYIVDQEVFRMHIVFVIGRNGHIYQYNKLTDLWHEHYQSPHLVLSSSPGTAMRPSHTSLTGSLFMLSGNGGLVQYQWNSLDGWEWVEHGTPSKDVNLIGAPGPCFDGTQLFVIGSNGHIYRRHLDQWAWKWTDHGHPDTRRATLNDIGSAQDEQQCSAEDGIEELGKEVRAINSFNKNCNDKIAPVRPIPFSEDAVIFELEDGRLAELRRPDVAGEWGWVRVIGTPTSLCLTNYLTAIAS